MCARTDVMKLTFASWNGLTLGCFACVCVFGGGEGERERSNCFRAIKNGSLFHKSSSFSSIFYPICFCCKALFVYTVCCLHVFFGVALVVFALSGREGERKRPLDDRPHPPTTFLLPSPTLSLSVSLVSQLSIGHDGFHHAV